MFELGLVLDKNAVKDHLVRSSLLKSYRIHTVVKLDKAASRIHGTLLIFREEFIG